MRFAPVALDRRSALSRLFEERDGPPQVLEGLGSKRRDGSRRRQLGLRDGRVGTDDQPPGPEPCDDVDAHRLQLGQTKVPCCPQAAGQPGVLAAYCIDGRVGFDVGSCNREHQRAEQLGRKRILPASGLVEPMDALLGFVHGGCRPQDQRAEAPLGAELARECGLLEEEPRHLRIGNRRTVVCMDAVEDHPCRAQACIGRAEQERGTSTQILSRRQQ